MGTDDRNARMNPHLRLYVAGDTERSVRAISNLKRITEGLGGRCTTEVVDIHADPKAAVEGRIVATPCLIKATPGPQRAVIGDLSNREAVLLGLGLGHVAGKARKAKGGNGRG